jgi:hypothetical protein
LNKLPISTAVTREVYAGSTTYLCRFFAVARVIFGAHRCG